MYLKRLEMQGFKSFANRTVLEFKPGITAVIGPNGSGKSNISDAIRWVLGEQSMKSLRSSKSEDIIFAGTQNRKSLGFAEVSLVLDNEDHSLPIDFAEVIVTRRIYRTGENNYFINKAPCRLKDINELFMDTGIGKDGYSIIGQGKIDEILSEKSEDRRNIFDEAAGITKYRARRDDSEKKLEQTKVNLLRINDILTELEANLAPLKEQSEKAKKFVELRDELKNIEVGLYLYKIKNLKDKIEELVKDKEVFENQNKEENDKLNELQELKEKIKQELDNIDEQIERVQNLSFESRNQIEKINSAISVDEEKKSNNEETKNRLENEISEHKSDIEALEEDKKNRQVKKEDLLKNKEKFDKELAEKEKELEELTKKLSSEQLKIEDKKHKNEELIDNRYNLQNNITMFDTNKENYIARKSQEEKELSKIISNLDERRNAKNEITKDVNAIQTQRNSDKEKLDKVQKEKENIDKKQKEYEEKIANLTDEKRSKTSRYNFLVETEKEKEGYYTSVKNLLLACDRDPALKKGVNGVLANIISVDDKYQVAIEMALSSNMQNIVTDTSNDAKKLIEYLRINKLGRASFLPISDVKGKKIENFETDDGFIGIASDLVKADKKYEGVVTSLLGRTIITENIESAIRIAKKNNHQFRIVTLDGDVINSSGSMTGGSVTKKTAPLLGRNAEIKNLKNELVKIDEKLEKIISEKDKYINDNQNIISEIEEMSNNLQQSEIKLASITEKYNAIENEINKLIANKEKTEELIQTLKNDIEKCDKDKEETENKIKEITEESNKLLAEINEFALNNKENQEYINNLNTDITDLKISVSSFEESNTSIEEMVERINADIEENKNRIDEKTKKIEETKNQNIELDKDIEELKQTIEKIKIEVSNSSEKSEELKNMKEQKNSEQDKVEEEISKQFETIQKVKEGLVKADTKKISADQDLTEVINDLWEDYSITPNNAMENYKLPENVAETQKSVNKLHNQIKDLGSVNVDAIDEYKKASERYELMNTQRADLESTMEKLNNVIEEMTSTMKKQFKQKFKLIQKNFNEIFSELFGGGHGELELDDEENVLESGITINVQPEGKKLGNMMLLSGGERALTAIALLFAILKINPAPFCILDEIEAALDDVNVYRYAEFLKKFTKTTQFLVITHRKGSMEAANTVYGVTMEENGVTKVLSLDLKAASNQ